MRDCTPALLHSVHLTLHVLCTQPLLTCTYSSLYRLEIGQPEASVHTHTLLLSAQHYFSADWLASIPSRMEP